MTAADEPGPSSASAQAPADRWYVLAVLTAVYALNIADRFSISTVIEPIRKELHLSDGGVAAITGVALGVLYVTIGIPIAAFADRANRRNILVLALAVWSAMTTLCGFARTSWHLFLARVGVGIGETGGTPPSTSILADKFPPSRRPMALTIYALGACLGAWLGSSWPAQRHSAAAGVRRFWCWAYRVSCCPRSCGSRYASRAVARSTARRVFSRAPSRRRCATSPPSARRCICWWAAQWPRCGVGD